MLKKFLPLITLIFLIPLISLFLTSTIPLISPWLNFLYSPLTSLISFIRPYPVFAQTTGQVQVFYINPDFHPQGKNQISAVLQRKSDRAFFYIEKSWYQGLSQEQQQTVGQALSELAQEFDQVIYPQLTDFYGQEWSPGIDNQVLITVLFHRTKGDARGYFREIDEYEALQADQSNEREMVYLDVETLFSQRAPSFLAHEFTHLITFNQKNRLRGVQEEVWLNELRAEYAPTYLGYDDNYQGSNLQERVKDFISSPSDSLILWANQKRDYGLINLFAQYMVDHYGQDLLSASLKSHLTGIASLEAVLQEQGVSKNLSQIFSDWAVAALLNDCSLGPDYCYKNKNLKGFTITPSLIFLPSTQKTSVSLNYSLQPWAGNWYRIMGGEGKLDLTIEAQDSSCFSIPYVLAGNSNEFEVSALSFPRRPPAARLPARQGEAGLGGGRDVLSLNATTAGKPAWNGAAISFNNFHENWTSLTLVPTISCPQAQDFSLSVSLERKTAEEKQIEALKAQIAVLKAKIAELKTKIAQILSQRISCSQITANLSLGMNSQQVECLQELLRAQGPDVYPQALVTGWFGPLTRQAVIRFQEKYASDILTPLGLRAGTGYVGSSTRAKINRMLTR